VRTATSKDGAAIAFDQAGEGPAVILVGGALALRSHPMLTHLAALLAPRFTVLTYDRRGRGDSGDTAPYAVEREVEDLAALIQAAGGSAAVFGLSSGGVLALEAAARGLAITKLAAYEPPFIVDDNDRRATETITAQLADLAASGRRGDAVAHWLTIAQGVPAESIALMRDEPSWSAYEAAAHTLAYDGAVVRDTMSGDPLPAASNPRSMSATAKRWAAVTMPTLVIDGGASPWWVRDHAIPALVATLPNAQRRTLDGQSQAVDPAALAPALVEFFTA
jgi:pimeloyl-ACP methyl ester carboxylesterase